MNTFETVQNYLEAIHILSLEKSRIRAIDICDYLGFKRSTVSVALRKLQDEGYVNIADNIITLTDKGLLEAQKTYDRHETLAHIFMALGIDEDTAYHDACLCEHDLSEKTYVAIKEYYQDHLKSER